MYVSAVGVALTEAGLEVEVYSAMDDAALDRMPENSEAKDAVTLESVAVAATLESSTLNDEASSESALVTSPVVELTPASEMMDEAALDTSDFTEETTLEMVSEVPVAEGCESVGDVPVTANVVPDSPVGSSPRPGLVVEPESVGFGKRPPSRPSLLELELLVTLAGVLDSSEFGKSPPKIPSFSSSLVVVLVSVDVPFAVLLTRGDPVPSGGAAEAAAELKMVEMPTMIGASRVLEEELAVAVKLAVVLLDVAGTIT